MSKEISLKHIAIDYFMCGICKSVSVEPVECRLCEQLFCNACLIDYLNNSQDNCCPLGCSEPTFERAGHAFDKIMSFVYARCKWLACGHEDCIKYLLKHEQVCRFRQEKMEIEVPDDIIAQRDMFWLQILGRIMSPQQYPCVCSQTPGGFQNIGLPNGNYSQNPCTPAAFMSNTPKTQQSFKF